MEEYIAAQLGRHQLTVEQDRIQDQRRASLHAHYAGALPLDVLKEEQDRLARQLDLVTTRLDTLDTTYEEARTHLQECLALAGDCQTIYTCGSEATRHIANQAFFTRIYLDADDTIRTEPTRSFGLLLDADTQQQALTWANQRQNATKRPTRTLKQYVEGSSKTLGVEVAGIEPASFSFSTGLLRAQPAKGFRPELGTGSELRPIQLKMSPRTLLDQVLR